MCESEAPVPWYSPRNSPSPSGWLEFHFIQQRLEPLERVDTHYFHNLQKMMQNLKYFSIPKELFRLPQTENNTKSISQNTARCLIWKIRSPKQNATFYERKYGAFWRGNKHKRQNDKKKLLLSAAWEGLVTKVSRQDLAHVPHSSCCAPRGDSPPRPCPPSARCRAGAPECGTQTLCAGSLGGS